MSLTNVAKRLADLGCDTKVNGEEIEITLNGVESRLSFDKDWIESIESFYKSRQFKFDVEKRALESYKSIEYLVVRLDPEYLYRVNHRFYDSAGNTVVLGASSKEFVLSHFESESYEKIFHKIKDRMERRANRLSDIPSNRLRKVSLRHDDIFMNFHTIAYLYKTKPRGGSVGVDAIASIKACLFALAYRKDESWELAYAIKSKGPAYPRRSNDIHAELEIPRASYDDSVVTFYKVAKSSQFPSQAFLAYYHILEFYFLRVEDESMYNAVCSQLNEPGFKSTYQNVTRLVSVINKNRSLTNDKDRLMGVLRKYVVEVDFIEFIRDLEKESNEKFFSKPSKSIFGERFQIKLDEGHALSGAAHVINHIRNAIVHSSDKYSREDCFLPLSESEQLVIRYIPVVKFVAEKVIFATAGRSE